MQHSVIGILFNSTKDHVLLVKRRDVPAWVLPGGGVDPGEEPDSAVIREVLEETGLQSSITRKIAEYSPVNKIAKFYTHVYECKVTGGSLLITEETIAIQFFPITHLPYPFFSLHKIWLEDALKNKPQIIKQPLKGGSYFDILKLIFTHPVLIFRVLLSRMGFPINKK